MAPEIQEIVDLEWTLFQQVQNRGGRAPCQDDRRTFERMRSSQLLAWSDELRQSYRRDLEDALRAGRNPLAEKYGYMMRWTAPAEYAEIRDLLPPVPAEKLRLIDAVCAAHTAWLADFAARCPRLAGRGRPAGRGEDGLGVTSFETYLRGELATYSERTLAIYLRYVERLRTEGRNLHEMVEEHTVRQYGYASLEEAERALGGQE